MADFAYKQTVLSLHCDGSDGATTIIDNSFTPKTVTVNNGAALSTSDKKFGTASLLLDGVNDYGNIPAPIVLVLGGLGLGEPGGKHTAGDAGHAPLAALAIPGEGVEQGLPQPGAIQPLAHGFGRMLVGREHLHAREPGLRGGLEPV